MNKKIEIVITESDLEDLKSVVYSNDNIHWIHNLPGVGDIDIELISEEEYEQREA